MTKSWWEPKLMTKKKQPSQGSSMRGGYRDNAGSQSGWKNSDTCTIRIPKTFASQLVDLARRLDNGENIDIETESNFPQNDLVTQSNVVGTDGDENLRKWDELECSLDIETQSKTSANDYVTKSIPNDDDTLTEKGLETKIDIDTESISGNNDFDTKSSFIDSSQSSIGALPDLTSALKEAKTNNHQSKKVRPRVSRPITVKTLFS